VDSFDQHFASLTDFKLGFLAGWADQIFACGYVLIHAQVTVEQQERLVKYKFCISQLGARPKQVKGKLQGIYLNSAERPNDQFHFGHTRKLAISGALLDNVEDINGNTGFVYFIPFC